MAYAGVRAYPEPMDQKHAGFAGQHNVRQTLERWMDAHPTSPLDNRTDADRTAGDQRFASWRCSVCGHVLAEHIVDQTGEHTVFECPVSHEGRVASDPPAILRETGQTKH
jgi:hypothetical protein